MDKPEHMQGNHQVTVIPENKAFLQSQSFSDQLIAAKFNTLPEETQQALAEFAAKGQLDLAAKLKNDQLTHVNAQSDIDKFINMQHDLAHIGNGENNYKSSLDVKTTTGNIHVERQSSRCYVATATYDDAYHPNVVILRDFRDRYLQKSFFGKCFIYAYYSVGPYVAYFPSHSGMIKGLSKKMLDQVVLKIVRKYYGLKV